jgi:carboxyl-terminal processing protease
MVMGGLAAAGLGLAGLSACVPAPWKPLSEQVFDQVRWWVDHNHYTRGQDTAAWRVWRADAEAYRARAAAAKDTIDLYWQTLMPMVNVFGDAHTFVQPPVPPAAKPDQKALDGRKPRIWRGDLAAGEGFYFTDYHGRGVVTWVAKGSPAERHDIEPGSQILSLRLSQRPGQSPWLALRLESPGGGVRDVEYAVENIAPDPPFQASRLPSGRTLVRLDHIDRDLVSRCVPALRGAGPAGALLDLRRCPGGLEDACAELVGELLGDRQPIGFLVQAGRRTPWLTHSDAPAMTDPMAVLIGPVTASAAEVIAANLQERKRPSLVGEATAGAVLEGRQFHLIDGGMLCVAAKDFLTPAGKRLEGAGVQPDAPARQTLAAVRAGRDLVVEAAEARLDLGRNRPISA